MGARYHGYQSGNCWLPASYPSSQELSPAQDYSTSFSLGDPTLELSPIHLKNLCIELMPDSGVNPAVSGFKAPMGITLAKGLMVPTTHSKHKLLALGVEYGS